MDVPDVTAGIVAGRSTSDRKATVGEMITDDKGRAIRCVGRTPAFMIGLCPTASR